MLNNKWIRTLCYILMAIMDIIAVVLIIYGISELLKEEKNDGGWIYIVSGILLPIIISVSIYPIFALANIDKNFSEINGKYDEIITQMKMSNKYAIYDYKESHLDETNSKTIVKDGCAISIDNSKTTSVNEQINVKINNECTNDKDTLSLENVDYINKKYGIDLQTTDSLEDIKKKIQSIDSNKNTIVITFQARVGLAKNIKEIASLISMHRVINSGK